MSVSAIWRLTVALAAVSGVFWIVERYRPARSQTRRPADTRLDLLYWFFTPLVTRAVTRLALALMFVFVALSQGVTFADLRTAATTRRTWATALPLSIPVPAILLLADLLAYVSHRAYHGAWLWPFHAVHHSSTTVNWLSSVRPCCGVS